MTSDLKSIKDLKDLAGKRILLRLDLNVPTEDGVILNDFRIKKSLPTIKFLLKNNARLIIISHLGGSPENSLKLIYEELAKKFELKFLSKNTGQEVQEAASNLQNGEAILLENLRLDPGEKKNDLNFANELSQLASIYVNDAFSSSHRKHASIVGLPKLLPSYMGLLFEEEIKNLSKILNPPHPFLFILGGAKFDTKIPLIIKYLDRADYVYVAGALANDFFKLQGHETGQSRISGKNYNLDKYLDRQNLILPKDVTVKNSDGTFVKRPNEVMSKDEILDIGVEALAEIRDLIDKSKFILWNGPLGNYEEGFRDGTINLARAITESSAHSIVGGGDTFAVLSKLDLESEFDFVSTAGGALLEFLYDGTLPGIEALKNGDN